MATRTNTSMATMVFLAILGLLSLALFVTTVISVAKVQRLTREKESAEANLAEAIPADQRGDDWDRLRQEAGTQGVVPYLNDAYRQAARLVTGSSRDDIEEMQNAVRAELELGDEASVPPLLPAIRELQTEIGNLEDALAAAQEDAATARRDYRDVEDRLEEAKDEHEETIAALTREVDRYQSELQAARTNFETTLADVEDRIQRMRRDGEETIRELEDENRALDRSVQTLEALVARLRGDVAEDTLRPGAEDALVDGTIVGINPGANEVFISRGRREKIVLGMTFEVYPIGTTIVREADGGYPPGKATIEVIRIDETSSACRIIRSSRGNPVVVNDVIANAVYDPRKTYHFVVFGTFDTNEDGFATVQEEQEIRAIINEWGGEVSDELNGNTDFVVLGRRPILPPEPKLDDPPELIQRYRRLVQQQRRYDELFEAAQATSIPVLNQNRLFTLTGLHADR